MSKILLVIFIFSVSGFGQFKKTIKTDAELNWLKGKVKNVKPNKYDETEYNERGFLIRTDDCCGCQYLRTYEDMNTEKQSRRLKVNVLDTTDSGNCGRFFRERQEYLQVPKKESRNSKGEIYYYFERFINYDLSYKTFDDPEYRYLAAIGDSKVRFLEETARVGKMLAWRLTYYFDEHDRLIEEHEISYDLKNRSVKYFYDDAKERLPASSEEYLQNYLQIKRSYRYDKFDKEGNWTSRAITISQSGSRQPPPQIEERTITYY